MKIFALLGLAVSAETVIKKMFGSFLFGIYLFTKLTLRAF
jgi:hypothetical protein